MIAPEHAVGDGVPQDTPLTALLAAAGRGHASAVSAILDAHPDLINQRGLLTSAAESPP